MFCKSELRGLGDISHRLSELGGTLLAISIDPPERSAQVVRGNKLEFPVLSDPDLTVIDAYGVRHRGSHRGQDHALPAAFLLDPDQRIQYKRVARRVQDRPNPEIILAAIERLSAGQATGASDRAGTYEQTVMWTVVPTPGSEIR